MKRYLIWILIGLAVVVTVVGSVFFAKVILKNAPKQRSEQSEQNQTTKELDYSKLFENGMNVCKLFPKEKIEELLGKTFVAVENKTNQTSKYTEYYCAYYQEEPGYKYEGNRPIVPKNLAVSFIQGDVKELREAYKLSNFQSKQDSDIPFSHQLIYSDKGKLQRLEIFLTDDLDLRIYTFHTDLNDEEALQFVKRFAVYFKDFAQDKLNTGSDESNNQDSTVPLPQDEDIIRNFAQLILEGKPDEAAKMMKINDPSPSQANSELQAWAVQFAAMNYIQVLEIKKANQEEWTEQKHYYKVVFDVIMNPASGDEPIPYYGWENGQNTRWLTLEKVGDIWKIAEIATSP